MNVAETNAQILKILSDLKNCQENLLNDMLIISEKPRILDERVLPTCMKLTLKMFFIIPDPMRP